MNREEYRKYYSYGASAFKNLSQSDPFHELRYRNLQSFLDGNPGVVPANRGNACCQKHVLVSGKYRCYLRNHPRCGWDGMAYNGLFDHPHMLRFKNVKKSYFLAAHPYNFREENMETYVSEVLEGLMVYVFATEHDWYYPGSTFLTLTSTPEVLKMLDVSMLSAPIAEVVGARPYKRGW